jgi:IS5 family transposase
MRFVGLALHDPVPDAKTIWLYREQLTRTGTLARLFERFDRLLAQCVSFLRTSAGWGN